MHYVCGCEVTEFDVFSKKIKKDNLGGKVIKSGNCVKIQNYINKAFLTILHCVKVLKSQSKIYTTLFHY